MEIIRKVKIEIPQGNFAFAKVTDIETGRVIPVQSIEIKMGIKDRRRMMVANIEVPISALDIDEIDAQIKLNYEIRYLLHCLKGTLHRALKYINRRLSRRLHELF